MFTARSDEEIRRLLDLGTGPGGLELSAVNIDLEIAVVSTSDDDRRFKVFIITPEMRRGLAAQREYESPTVSVHIVCPMTVEHGRLSGLRIEPEDMVVLDGWPRSNEILERTWAELYRMGWDGRLA
jgi:hypothetical protein